MIQNRTRVMILKTKLVLRVNIVSQVKFEKIKKMLGLDGIWRWVDLKAICLLSISKLRWRVVSVKCLHSCSALGQGAELSWCSAAPCRQMTWCLRGFYMQSCKVSSLVGQGWCFSIGSAAAAFGDLHWAQSTGWALWPALLGSWFPVQGRRFSSLSVV